MGKPLFTKAVWTAICVRYRDGPLIGRRLAAEQGIKTVTLTSKANRDGYYRTTTRDVMPAAAETAGPDAPSQPTQKAMKGFVFDPRNPKRSIRSLHRKITQAAREGRTRDVRELMACLALIRREFREIAADAGTERAAIEGSALPSPPAEALILRPAQTPPVCRADGTGWSTWLFLGGRGAGKTQAGASWLADEAERAGSGGRLALIGPTLHDVREVMIGGPSGLMSLPRWAGQGTWPVYEPSRRRLRFPNGAEAFVFSAEDPDSLRGPQFEAAWADEFCAWARPEETLAMLRLGLRVGEDPRLVVTTTPRPMAALKALRDEAGCVMTHAPTRDNADHLAPGFMDELTALFGGTRREAQEIDGLIVEMEGGLFRAEDLSRARLAAVDAPPERFDRIVVAVDPTTTPGGDACGIVAVGRIGEVAHVLADRSMRGLTPDAWARRAIALMDEVGASEIVAEVNQGGEMVVQTLKTARRDVTVKQVRATQGKRLRAEPVAALYEQGRVRHRGAFREMEEELMALGGPDEGRMSLDRADALVWAVTELMLGARWEGPRRGGCEKFSLNNSRLDWIFTSGVDNDASEHTRVRHGENRKTSSHQSVRHGAEGFRERRFRDVRRSGSKATQAHPRYRSINCRRTQKRLGQVGRRYAARI